MIKIEPSDKLFFGRKHILEWTRKWLLRCEDRGVVLGIFGMGGIGKTAILHQLQKIHKCSIYVDCSKDNLMELMNTISTRARNIGFNTPRYDRLREIRLWFLEGIQPAQPASKRWIKDLVQWIPQISTAVKMANAISVAGKKLVHLITNYYGDIEQWFKDTLGSDYGTVILELMARDPEQTSNLFLEALLSDLNSAVMEEDVPLLILMDSFEYIDSNRYDNTPYPGLKVKLCHAEKWHLFLNRLNGAVGIISGRSLPHIPKKLQIQRYDKEIKELDEDSCGKLLSNRGISKPKFVETITRVSHRNPFLISTICDIWERGELNLEEILELESEALLEVREKTWSLLFSKAKEIWKFIESTSLIPFFDFHIMLHINPGFNQINWKELTRLSFVEYDEPYWTLHDLARELVLVEQGQEKSNRANEVRKKLGKAYSKTQNPILLGLLLSATNHISENRALMEIFDVIEFLVNSEKHLDIITALEAYEPVSNEGHAIVQLYLGRVFLKLNRIGDAKSTLLDVLELLKELDDEKDFDYARKKGETQELLGIVHLRLGEYKLAEKHYTLSLQIFEKLESQFPGKHTHDFMRVATNMGSFLIEAKRMNDGEKLLKKALSLNNSLDPYNSENFNLRFVILTSLGTLYKDTGRISKAEDTYKKAIDMIDSLDTIPDEELNAILSKTYNNLGLLYYNTGEFNKARISYENGLKIALMLINKNQHEHRELLPDILTNIGLLNAMETEFETAIDNYNDALRIYRELADENPGFYTRDIALVLMNMGFAHRERGDVKDAIPFFEESIIIYRKLSIQERNLYRPRLANGLSHLGVAYILNQKLDDAGKVIEESLDIFEKLDQEILQLHLEEYAFALNHMGTYKFRTRRLKRALLFFEKSIKIFEELAIRNPSGLMPYVAMTLSNISAVYIEKEDGTKAEEIALQALQIYSRVMKNRPLIFLGNGLKLIANLRTSYEKILKLSSEEVEAKLRKQLEAIFESRMTDDILKLLKESGF